MEAVFFNHVKKLMESFTGYELDDDIVQLMTNFLNELVNKICAKIPDLNLKDNIITDEIMKKLCESL